MSDATWLNESLIADLKRRGCIRTSRVEAAFRAVRRHHFVPGLPLDQVYRDDVIMTKRLESDLVVSSSSQPAIMAIMLEQLRLRPGQRALEVGAGTGYNAALMAHLVGQAGQVVALDIDEDLVASARAHLEAAGFPEVQVVCTDGADGYPAAAPYDRIVLTVGAWDIAPPWWEQLKPGGRLLLPLAIRGSMRGLQYSVAFDRANEHLTSVSVRDAGFMPLRGALVEPRILVPVGHESSIYLASDDLLSLDGRSAYRFLTGPYKDVPTGVRLGSGLILWLGVHEPSLCALSAVGDAARGSLVPPLFHDFGSANKRGRALLATVLALDKDPLQFCSTLGLVGDDGVCMLMLPAAQSSATEVCAGCLPPLELWLRSFGSDEPVRRLMEHIAGWEAAGRPSPEGVRIRGYPRTIHYVPSPGEWVIEKKWSRLVLDWPHSATGVL